MYSNNSTILYAIITLVFIVGLIQAMLWALEAKIKKIPWMPDVIEKPLAYLIVFSIGFGICSRMHFSFFPFLGCVWFEHEWEGWLATSALLCAGNDYIKQCFSLLNALPYVLGNTYGAFRTGAALATPPNTATESEMKEGQENQV